MIPVKEQERKTPGGMLLLRTLSNRVCRWVTPGIRRGIWTLFLGFAVAMLPAKSLAPLGVGYTAANLSGRWLFPAALGTLTGYAVRGGREGLLFGGAALSLLALGELLRIKNRSLPQIGRMTSAAVMTLIPGMGELLANRSLSGFVLLNVRVLLCAGTTVLFEAALSVTRQRPAARDCARLLLCGAVLGLLYRIPLGGGLTAGSLAGAFLTYYTAVKGRDGAKAGLLLGLVMDLSLNKGPCYSVVWGIAGLAGNLFLPLGTWGSSLCFLLSGAFGALWALAFPGATAAEMCIAGAVGSLLPVRGRGERMSPGGENRRLAEELEKRCIALQGVIREMDIPPEPGREWMRPLLADLRRQVCTGCPAAETCTYPTAEKLGVLLCRFASGGMLTREDLPEDMRKNCPETVKTVIFLNRGLALRLYGEQLRGNREETRRILCAQYGAFAEMLKTAVTESRRPLRTDRERQENLRTCLQKQNIPALPRVYRDEKGVLYAELRGKGFPGGSEERNRREISRCLKREMEVTETAVTGSGVCVTYREKRGLILEAEGISAHAPGQEICGDVSEYLRMKNGDRYLLLSDGMGHGAEARREARRALSILKGNLRAGMTPELALHTLLSALFLRQGGTVFAAVDMLRFNTLSGEAWFYKCGSAPTWLYRSGRTEKIPAGGAPAGAELTPPAVRKEQLSPGDWILLLSDGVSDGEEDEWIGQLLEKNKNASAGEMAGAVLSGRPLGEDDGTVIAVRIKRPGE